MALMEHNAPWAILFNNDAFIAKQGTLMGRHAAGSAYLRALANEGYKECAILTRNNYERENFINLFKSFLNDKKIDLNLLPWDRPDLSKDYGGIFLGDPQLGNQSVLRSNFGHNKYSIVGITHTTMSKGIMDFLADIIYKPVQEWDSLICTSKCVKDTVDEVLQFYKDDLSDRLGAKKFTIPKLPIIPLGVHLNDFEFSENQKIEIRDKFGINKNDICLTFVGRLSFHAKAHYFPMYKALQEVSRELDKNRTIHLVQVGWFANNFIEKQYKEDAKLISPDIKCHFVDGLDQNQKNLILSASDIFISLTDNYQETFGLTPIEAMAAGVPALVTDWNGYKDTVRDNIDGFTVPTIALKSGSSIDLLYQYYSNIINYDQYIGYASQRVAVDIDITIKKLKEMILNDSLRKEMGKHGKERAKSNFSWSVVLGQYNDLRSSLDDIRLNNNKIYQRSYIEVLDPSNIFKSYPTLSLSDDLSLFSKTEILDKKDYLFNSDSINLSKDYNSFDPELYKLKPNFDIINQIIVLLNKNKLKVSDLHKNIDIDNDQIDKAIVIMLKFDLIGLGD